MFVISATYPVNTVASMRYLGEYPEYPVALLTNTENAFLFDTKEQAESFLKARKDVQNIFEKLNYTAEIVKILEVDEGPEPPCTEVEVFEPEMGVD